jgi:hypothetical protein
MLKAEGYSDSSPLSVMPNVTDECGVVWRDLMIFSAVNGRESELERYQLTQ